MRTTTGETAIVSWASRARIVGLLLTVVLLGLAASHFYRDGLDINRGVAEIHSIRQFWWAPAAFSLCYLVLTSLLAPGTLLHLIAGAAWGVHPGVWIGLVACNLTCSLQFWGARLFMRERLRRTFARAGLDELDAKAEKSGLVSVLVVRMLPMPMIVANSLVGVSRIRWRHFALGSFIGTLPMVVAFTFFASAIVEGAEGAREVALRRSLLAGLGLAVMMGLGHLVRMRLAAKRARRCMARPSHR